MTTRSSKGKALLTALFFLASLLLAVGNTAQPATATAADAQLMWQHSVGYGVADVVTHPSGNVTLGCGSTATWGKSGEALASLACNNGSSLRPVISSKGYMYVVNNVSSMPSSEYIYAVQAYRVENGTWTKAWHSDIRVCGSERNTSPIAIKLGADGKVYSLITSPACEQRNIYLVGFDPLNGSVTFETALNLDPFVVNPQLVAYKTGLIVVTNTNFRYFDYQGDENTAATHTLSLTGNEYFDEAHWVVNAAGRVFAAIPSYDECSAGRITHIVQWSPGKPAKSIPVSGCRQFSAPVMIALPDGQAAIALSWENTSFGGTIEKVTPTGLVLLYEMSHDLTYGYISSIASDVKGNILIGIGYVNADQPDGQYTQRRETILTMLNGNGLSVGSFSTESLPPGYSYVLAAPQTDLASGILYVSLQVCTPGWYDPICSENRLFALKFDGLGIDYPRGTVQGLTNLKPRNLVTVGDSFSSGESLEPFMPPTGRDGCHRSNQAAGPTLANDPDVNLVLKAFRACAGATTQSVVDGMNGERGQLDWLKPTTDVVTITIGGNNVGFEAFAVECLNPATECAGESQATTHALYAIDHTLPGELDSLFANIVATNHAPNAQVYVVGYPLLVPKTDAGADLGACWYLSDTERVSIRDVITRMDLQIDLAARRAGDRFHYVDPNGGGSPFEGHELCHGGSYFNGATVFPNYHYSYHPNTLGQQAYKQLIKGYSVV